MTRGPQTAEALTVEKVKEFQKDSNHLKLKPKSVKGGHRES